MDWPLTTCAFAFVAVCIFFVLFYVFAYITTVADFNKSHSDILTNKIFPAA